MSNSKFRKSIHSKVHVTIREYLIGQRLKLKLSQRELAKKINVTHSLIGKIETGDRRLDIVEIVEYCIALELNPKKILDLVISLVSE